MASKTMKKLTDSELLIDIAKEGTTITSENWIEIMTAIKEAVNNNAEAAKATPVEIVIGPSSSSTNAHKWAVSQFIGGKAVRYRCIISRTDLDKLDRVQANFYNSEGTEINCNYKQDDTQVIVFSRVDAAITAVFR